MTELSCRPHTCRSLVADYNRQANRRPDGADLLFSSSSLRSRLHRSSDPTTAIGCWSVRAGKLSEPIAICHPERPSCSQDCLFPCNYWRRPMNEQCIVPPKPISLPFPDCTEKARKQGIKDDVEVQITVGTDDRITDAKVTRSLEPFLGKRSLEAARNSRFESATLEGKPVAVTTEYRKHLSSLQLALQARKQPGGRPKPVLA